MEKNIAEKIYKINDLAELMAGYCENADGQRVFVECLIDSLNDIRKLSLEIIEEI